jgi:hypothetical protein
MVYPVVKAFILSNNGQASAAAKAPRAAVTKTGKAAAPAKSTRRRSA